LRDGVYLLIARKSFVKLLRSKGVVIEEGPIRIPIHMRETFKESFMDWMKPVPHSTHKQGSCPIAEYRCKNQELMLFQASVLDKIELDLVEETVKQIKRVVFENFNGKGKSDHLPISSYV